MALHQLGRPGARDLLSEVLSLASLGGMRWFVENAHPGLATMIECDAPGQGAPIQPAGVPVPQAAALGASQQSPGGASTSGLLTPREGRILALLAAGMANKEIARAMDIGEQTVKWHLKNIFTKLNAASRRHAVDRARLLGLLSA